eukprot:scaffold7458_cov89-Skeletonema_marinoi.AAC.1
MKQQPTTLHSQLYHVGNELNAAIDAGCLGCTFVQPTNQPTSQPASPSHLSYSWSVRTNLCRGQSRADQSQAAYNADTITNTSDDIDYSIGRSMNRL